MLSADQRRCFDDSGIVTLRGAIDCAAGDAMRAALWAELERRCGLREHDPASWREPRPAGFQALAKRGAFAAMASPAVRAALDSVFGASGWLEPPRWGQPLVCFPERVAWDVPHASWHLDVCGSPQCPLAAVRVFAFLTRVMPRGGGTAAVAGSHRLVEELARRAGKALRSADARAELAALDPWLAALEARPGADRVRRFMHDGTDVMGVPLRVVELCGEPGDVTLMRADTLHAIAPNTLDTPRFVVAQLVTSAAAARA
jgi:Phytanoyl-CoA dioxygenase (PhyH)